MISIEQLTLAIAITSFILSTTSWIKDFYTQRKNIHARILDVKSYEDILFFDLLIENRSRLPIAITQISILIESQVYHCTPIPALVERTVQRTGNTVTNETIKYSTALPIQLASLGAFAPLVLFEHLPALLPDDATALTLLIGTNRGRRVKKTLPLPKDWVAQRKPL